MEMRYETDSTVLQSLERENERLVTFTNWPVAFINKETLAKNGFYYKGKGDNVVCIFCGVEIANWEQGDDPAKEHRRYSPNCKLLEASQNDTASVRAPRSEDECEHLIERTSKINMFDRLDDRFRSFEHWPISMRQTGNAMAQAGFYYSGSEDRVICFSCNLGLHKWEGTDEPWFEHAKWNPNCSFVLQKKGKKFVQDILKSQIRNDKDSKKTFKDFCETVLARNQLLCSVCKWRISGIVFFPCRHLATCKRCNKNLTKCPICGTEMERALEVIIPS